MGQWFEQRGKCCLCGWTGPTATCAKIRKTFTAEFFVCPQCGENRVLDDKVYGKRRGYKNCIATFATHSACGFWHKPGTPCLGRRLTREEWLEQIAQPTTATTK